MGAGLAYYTLPRALDSCIDIGGRTTSSPRSQPGKYFTLITYMMLAFGIGFEFPILLVFLQMAGVITPQQLRGARRYAIVGICVLVAVITPSGDPISMLMLSVPMIIFYEVSILIGRVIERRRVRRRLMSDDAGRCTAGYDFPLDPFQLRAIAALDEGRSVLVAAPTGLGQDGGRRARRRQGAGRGPQGLLHRADQGALEPEVRRPGPPPRRATRVGLLTGDNAINGDAPVVVMTTEVLRNMIYAASPALDGLRYVVLDEVHFLQDAYRGPGLGGGHDPPARPTSRLVCLSATVSNAEELAEWISTVRGPTEAVIEERRPVELQNLYCVGDKSTQDLHLLPTLVDGRPNPEADRLDDEALHLRGAVPRAGRAGASSPRAAIEVIERLQDEAMLPAITFIFSRKACDEARDACLDAGLRLTTPDERARDPGHRRRAHRVARRRRPRRARASTASSPASRWAWRPTTPGWCRRSRRRSRRASRRGSPRRCSPPRRSPSASTCRPGRW